MIKSLAKKMAAVFALATFFVSCNNSSAFYEGEDFSPSISKSSVLYKDSASGNSINAEVTGENSIKISYNSQKVNYARLYISEGNGAGLILANQDMNYENGTYSYTVSHPTYTEGSSIYVCVLVNNGTEFCVPCGILADSTSWMKITFQKNSSQESSVTTETETKNESSASSASAKDGKITSNSDFSSYEYFSIKAKCSSKVLDVDSWGSENGKNIQQWEDGDNQANQRWYIEDNGDSSYSIINKNSLLCLDVDGWGTEDGKNVQQWEDNKQANQRWYIEYQGEGYFRIINVHSGKALDVSSASNENGANVQQWTWNASPAQLWEIKGFNSSASYTDAGGRYAYGKSSHYESKNSTLQMLHTSSRQLVNASGENVTLRGTNAGGYLVQELWMTPTQSTSNAYDQTSIMNTLISRFGSEKAYEILSTYEFNYWNDEDFKNVKNMGMNAIRLPFWWRNLVDENGNWYGGSKDSAYAQIDYFIDTASSYGLYVILDFHGAPGSQNGSDHSGVDGGNDKLSASQFFFGSSASSNQELYLEIWKATAERYKDNGTVAGYDLLNEPYCTYRWSSPYSSDYLRSTLWSIYDRAYKTIRSVDQNHIIIMEAVWWADDLPDPASYSWTNVMYEYHQYEYSDYDNANGSQISGLKGKINNAKSWNVPIYIGEFALFNSIDTWKQGISYLVNNEPSVNWTTWTYKTTSDYGNWGLYHHPSWLGKVNLESASFEEIKSFYEKTATSYGTENTSLTEVFKSCL